MKWDDIWNGTIQLKVGDHVFVHGPGAISAHIRVLSGLYDLLKFGQPSIANHVGIISKVGSLKGRSYISKKPVIHRFASILEALHRFEENGLGRYDDGKSGVVIMRDMTISDDDKEQIVDNIRTKYKGRLYNYPAIAMQVFEQIFSYVLKKKVYPFTRWNLFKKLTYCSRSVAVETYNVTGKTFDCPPASATPDDMLDYELKHLNKKFKLIFFTDNIKSLLMNQIQGTLVVDI